MRIRHITAVIVSLSWALLAAACLQGPMATPESSDGREPIGEAQQETGRAYGSKDFPFVVFLKDDGKDEGGGWQTADRTLGFVERNWGIPSYFWECPVRIGMPIRNQDEGRITPSRAALYSAEVANAVVDPLLDSRASWKNQGTAFCIELVDAMQAMWKKLHPKLGATVNRL